MVLMDCKEICVNYTEGDRKFTPTEQQCEQLKQCSGNLNTGSEITL